MNDHHHLDRNDEPETKGLINEEEGGRHHQRSGAERLHEMKNIAELITDVCVLITRFTILNLGSYHFPKTRIHLLEYLFSTIRSSSCLHC